MINYEKLKPWHGSTKYDVITMKLRHAYTYKRADIIQLTLRCSVSLTELYCQNILHEARIMHGSDRAYDLVLKRQLVWYTLHIFATAKMLTYLSKYNFKQQIVCVEWVCLKLCLREHVYLQHYFF